MKLEKDKYYVTTNLNNVYFLMLFKCTDPVNKDRSSGYNRCYGDCIYINLGSVTNGSHKSLAYFGAGRITRLATAEEITFFERYKNEYYKNIPKDDLERFISYKEPIINDTYSIF